MLLAALVLQEAALQTPEAAAHANLDRAEPPADARVRQATSRLLLYFTQPIVPRSSWVALSDAAGKERPVALEFEPAEPKLMRARLGPLEPGTYTAKWQSLSADDDDYADGSYGLTVLRPDGTDPSGAPPAGSVPGDGGGSSSPLAFVMAAVAGAVVISGAVMFARRPRKAA